jgi:hypothetical protein
VVSGTRPDNLFDVWNPGQQLIPNKENANLGSARNFESMPFKVYRANRERRKLQMTNMD